MKIIGRDKLKFDKDLDVVFYLGKEFSIESTNLFNIIPNMGTKVYIVNESGDDLQKLCPFYHIEAPFIEPGEAIFDKAVFLFIQPGEEDIINVRTIVEKLEEQPRYLLLNRLDTAYTLDSCLEEFDLTYIVPDFRAEIPVHIKGLDSQENPFYFSEIYSIKLPERVYLGDYINGLFGLDNKGGRLYGHLDNTLKSKKQELDNILSEKIPFKALELAYDKFRARNLSTRELVEKNIMEGSYGELPQLIMMLVYEDQHNFPYVYDIITYLNGKLPVDVNISTLKNIINMEGLMIDKIYLPLIYDKLAVLYQAKGEFRKSADVYGSFCGLDLVKKELLNIRSSFIRKQVYSLLLSGDYKDIIKMETELAGNQELLSDDRMHILNYVVLAYNENGDYDKALKLIDEYGLINKEMLMFRSIILLNKDSLKIESLEDPKKNELLQNDLRFDFYNDLLKAYILTRDNSSLDTIKIYNKISNSLPGLKGKYVRKAKVLIALLKGRALMSIGNFREAKNEFSKGIDTFSNDFEEDNRCMVFSMYKEKANLHRVLDEQNETLSTANEALAYKVAENSDYSKLNLIQLLLYKLEIINKKDESDTDIVEALNLAFKDNLNKPAYKKLKIEMNKIRVKAYLKNDRVDEALSIGEESWKEYNTQTELEIAANLYEILISVKEYCEKSDKQNEFEQALDRIAKQFVKNKDMELDVKGGQALKELADLYISKMDKKNALEKLNIFLEAYQEKRYKRLETAINQALMSKAEILFEDFDLKQAKAMAIQVQDDRDVLLEAKRDLLLAKCEDGLLNIEAAIYGYEDYLGKYQDLQEQKANIIFVFRRLSSLLKGIGKKQVAINYLDKLISNEEEPYRQLEAWVEKADLVYEKDKARALELYKGAALKFKDYKDERIMEQLTKIYAKLAGELGGHDIGLFREMISLALQNFSDLNDDIKKAVYTALKNGASAMEKSGIMEQEKWMRIELINHYKDYSLLEYQVELARNYYRLLKISIDEGFLTEMDKSYEALMDYTSGKSDGFISDYRIKGKLDYGIECYRRQNFLEAKGIFTGLLEKKDSIAALFFYAKTLECLDEKKAALKILSKLLDHEAEANEDIDLYSEAVFEKIKLVKSEKTIFNRNLRKFAKELQTKLLPNLDERIEKHKQLALWYELGQLYEVMNNKKRAQEIFRNLIEKYSKDNDFRIDEQLKKVYAALD